MDIIEEENNEIKNDIKNKVNNSSSNNINTDYMNVDLSSKEQTPSHKNINYMEKNDASNFKKFKPYLSSKDEYIFDENLILDDKIKELHKHKNNYLNYQSHLSTKKRFILLDWIMEVSSQLHFKRKTYYFCVNLIELFFSKSIVNTEQIQLVGIACLLISAKNEELTIPQISYFAKAYEDSYTKNQILKQEYIILKTINMKIKNNNLIK